MSKGITLLASTCSRYKSMVNVRRRCLDHGKFVEWTGKNTGSRNKKNGFMLVVLIQFH
jgi:hypothetical protein